MVLARLINSVPFFNGLKDGQTDQIAKVSHLMDVEAGYKFFSEGDELDTFYLIEHGFVDITIGIPDRTVKHKFVDQLTRNMLMEEIAVSRVSEGEIFGWSAIIPPHESTANAVAATPCSLIAVNYRKLGPVLDQDPDFACMMAIKAAQIVRKRLRDRRIESLAFS